jgi:hypothetical protein
MTINFDDIQDVTPAQQFKAVQYAIAQLVLGGQSVSLGGKAVTYSNLADLRALRDDLQAQIARESGHIGYFGFNR